MKTSNGVPPSRLQIVGSFSATLNDGLQASLMKILDGFAAAASGKVRMAAAATAAMLLCLNRPDKRTPSLGADVLRVGACGYKRAPLCAPQTREAPRSASRKANLS